MAYRVGGAGRHVGDENVQIVADGLEDLGYQACAHGVGLAGLTVNRDPREPLRSAIPALPYRR